MKKTMTKKAIHSVYVIMSSARLTELKNTEDKVAVLRILRELRQVAMKYETDAREAAEKLAPEGYEDSRRKAVAYENDRRAGKQPTTMTEQEYRQFIATHIDYEQARQAAMHDVDNAEVELEFEPVGEGVLEPLMAANGWTVEQYFTVEDAMK